MKEIILMNKSSETENYLRWIANINGVTFTLYIPMWRVPQPWPAQIIVIIKAIRHRPQEINHVHNDNKKPISAIVEKVSEHGRTAQYQPIGSREKWEIGKPYIPFKILNSISPGPLPQILQIEIGWDYNSGNWDEN